MKKTIWKPIAAISTVAILSWNCVKDCGEGFTKDANGKCVRNTEKPIINQDSLKCVNNPLTKWVDGKCVDKEPALRDTTLYFNADNLPTKEQLQGAKKPGIRYIILEIDDPDFSRLPGAALKNIFSNILAFKNDGLFHSIKSTKILVNTQALGNAELIDILILLGLTATDNPNEMGTKAAVYKRLGRMGAILDGKKTVRTNRFAKNGKADFRSHSTATLATA